jgi:hypothetical protein
MDFLCYLRFYFVIPAKAGIHGGIQKLEVGKDLDRGQGFPPSRE